MVRCPNCGQKTSGDYCHCCKYPILKGKPTRAWKAEKLAKKQAEIEAREAKILTKKQAEKPGKPKN